MTIGNDALPGIVTDVESLPAISVGGISDANVLIVGHGNLSDGSANPNEPYTITRGSQVSSTFGTENAIADNITDALNEGALPVYAVVTDEIDATESDVSSTSGTLSTLPVAEDPERITVDGDSIDVEIVYGTPETPSSEGTVQINPVTGEYEFDTAPSGVSIEYTSFDYTGALDAVQEEAPEEIDYIYVLSENSDVVTKLNDTVNQLEQYKNNVIGGVGINPLTDDVSSLEAPVDNSRMQVFYPSRNVDGDSIMGAVGGLKASLGINGSSMNKRLSTHTRLIDRIDEADQIALLEETIVPVATETRGALLVDDPTCVAEDNTEESNMADGYSRLIVNRVTDIVHDTERPYVGKLNKPSTRGSLQASLRTGLGFLEEQDAILNYNVRVFAIDSMSAQVDLSVETTKPLRNIYNDIAVGGN